MTFPPSLSRLKSSGAIIFRHPCHVCGEPYAAHGRGVHVRAALLLVQQGKPLNKDLLGVWTCGPDGCRKAAA